MPVASAMMEEVRPALAVVQDERPICRPQLSSRFLPGPNVAQTSRSSFSPSFKSWRVRVGQPPAAKLTPTSSTLRLRCTRLRSFSAAAASLAMRHVIRPSAKKLASHSRFCRSPGRPLTRQACTPEIACGIFWWAASQAIFLARRLLSPPTFLQKLDSQYT